ncbi:MAG: MG(2+) CHELATASE FAMILY PROTEIN / ComM-related protein, partial [uncultured Thermomicrobiales bacterium]
ELGSQYNGDERGDGAGPGARLVRARRGGRGSDARGDAPVATLRARLPSRPQALPDDRRPRRGRACRRVAPGGGVAVPGAGGGV